jgi:hypothetical protein
MIGLGWLLRFTIRWQHAAASPGMARMPAAGLAEIRDDGYVARD